MFPNNPNIIRPAGLFPIEISRNTFLVTNVVWGRCPAWAGPRQHLETKKSNIHNFKLMTLVILKSYYISRQTRVYIYNTFKGIWYQAVTQWIFELQLRVAKICIFSQGKRNIVRVSGGSGVLDFVDYMLIIKLRRYSRSILFISIVSQLVRSTL